ncbi:hypothetical protein FHS76_003979 [Ochrobactrum daejeonense]|uniref:Lysozyme inhibitor LprI N-terminal domain-containing protein n=1 Tax=Brucella daejeonensis TaxID=659015 RepID=A0A7W9B0Q1_9HYPH|nr:hypothetical protein [Brucella daejeonensis]MBB5704064.1 hypothetical protein [Brucella daejeonensis]
MPMRKATLLTAMLTGILMLPPTAEASPKTALQTLTDCLKGKVNPEDARVCIGRYSDPCAAKAENAAMIPQIAEQSQCLLDEAAAWNTLRDRAVKGWKEDNGTSFSATIAKTAKESERFSRIKCSVFQNADQYGQTGMALEAECLRDEAARTAIFIGYSLN